MSSKVAHDLETNTVNLYFGACHPYTDQRLLVRPIVTNGTRWLFWIGRSYNTALRFLIFQHNPIASIFHRANFSTEHL